MSDKIIDFEERKVLKDCDPHLTQKIMGARWFQYMLDYDHEGEPFSIHIWAKSFEEAEAKLAAIKVSGRIAGQAMSEIVP